MPELRHRTLRMVFTTPPSAGYGYASFWCDTCLEGIHVSRAPVPAGVTALSTAAPIEDRTRGIPNYRLVT
ncbi:hypothetical protein [Micromonospora chalcea]|uniref:hypothetical protein n=2 Tax=Micromonospora chalcea TaxID=1874 RepID=UPI0036B29AD9